MINPLRTLFGDAFRKYRGEQSLEDVATEVGISKGDLSEIERGLRNVTLDMLHRIASALHLKVIIKFKKERTTSQ